MRNEEVAPGIYIRPDGDGKKCVGEESNHIGVRNGRVCTVRSEVFDTMGAACLDLPMAA